MKLSQVLGLERAAKSRAHRDATTCLRTVQHPELFAGILRTYRPLDDEGERFPPESTLVQFKAEDKLIELRGVYSEWWDTVASKEWGNTKARADVKVGDELVVADVPVGFLLFLQKRLDDILDFLKNLPTLDPTEEWDMERSSGLYRSGVVVTIKTKKVPRSHILVQPTEHHPAQAQMYNEDVKVGEWDRVRFSGALPPSRVDDLIRRTRRLRDAVVSARELANTTDVEKQEVSSALFNYIFGPSNNGG